MKTILDQYNADAATHYLSCTHSMNSRSQIHYKMPAIFLGTTKSGMCKVVVFGRRYWKDTEHIKRVRYVESWRLTPKDRCSQTPQ